MNKQDNKQTNKITLQNVRPLIEILIACDLIENVYASSRNVQKSIFTFGECHLKRTMHTALFLTDTHTHTHTLHRTALLIGET